MQPAPPARGISKRSAEIPLAYPPISLRQQGIVYGLRQQGRNFLSGYLTQTGLLMEAATARERFADYFTASLLRDRLITARRNRPLVRGM